MAGNLQVQGGKFQDMEGNLLVNGYLLWQLSHDELYSNTNSQIVAGLKVRMNLDSSGNVPSNPATFIYDNSSLSPSGSFYTVRCFKSDGTEAWKSPQTFQLTTSPNPLDLGTLIPLSPPGGLVQGSTVTRVASINFQIDGGGSVPSTGTKGQISIPTSSTLTGWVITADQTGSAVVDILKSSYASFPTTSSIAGTDKPTLSSARKNEDLALTGWGSTAITAGDIVQFALNSVTTVTFIDVTLNVTIP
jgi:hypothetical protein